MDFDNPLYKVIDYILNVAGDHELEAIRMAWEKRTRGQLERGYPPQMSLTDLAGDMAKKVQNRLSVDSDTVAKTARGLVADMILQYDQNIDPVTLEKLLDHWAPLPGTRTDTPDLPSDMLLEMVKQFVSYSLGMMKESEIKEMPEGWVDKYWSAFPAGIQESLSLFLKGETGASAFWKEIHQELGDS